LDVVEVSPHRIVRKIRGRKPERTPAGYIERRRIQYVTWDQLWTILKLAGAFALVLMVGASLGILWAWQNAQDIRGTGSVAVKRSCLERADIRITTAEAMDSLRLLAIRATPRTDPKDFDEGQRRFVRATQAPIDELLSKAVGHRVSTEPPGPIPPSVTQEIRAEVTKKCDESAEQFGRVPPDGTPPPFP
jgi:hypothetical protein